MVSSRYLSSLLLPTITFLSLSAEASPYPRAASRISTLKVAVRINSNGIRNIAVADRARVELLQNGGSASTSVTNEGLSYTANIGVGTPPTYYTLLVDTGGSNTWVGANKSYVKTSTSQDTGSFFFVSYGMGSNPTFTYGEEYLDTVTISSDLVITKQTIGVALSGSTAEFGGLDGILGLGPVDLTQHTVGNEYEVPTVMDNLYEQGTISSEVLGIFFSPVSSDGATGELTFGGYDASKIMGNVNYVPVTSTYPSNGYWGINQTIGYGATPILNNTAGIVDSGTTLILIASDAFDKYQAATGGTLDSDTTLLKISSEQYNSLSSLYFQIGDVSYELTPNAQIWPRSLNTVIGGTADSIYLIIADIGSNSGSGLDFMNGYCFLERFYSVYDAKDSRVGFATTEYTNAISN